MTGLEAPIAQTAAELVAKRAYDILARPDPLELPDLISLASLDVSGCTSLNYLDCSQPLTSTPP